MNELQIFKNKNLNLEIRAVKNDDGSISVNLEDVARGLGFTQIAKSGNEVVRWERVRKYLNEFSVPTCGDDDFIPESVFYLLAMKASNETAKAFQIWVATEVLPTLRRTGTYSIQHDPMQALRLMFEATEQIEARVTQLESVQTISQNEYSEIGTRIQKRINNVIKDEGLIVRGNQRKKLFNEFNHEVLLVGGVKHRNQILKKDYYKILDFINDWQPSRATIIGVLGYEQQDFKF